MENRKFIVETKLSIMDYVMTVNDIVSEYFDEENNYTPHIGKVKAMCVFYNKCVTDNNSDAKDDITDALESEKFIYDKDFIDEFNKAIKGDGLMQLDFSNAFGDAMQIVNTRKNSINNAIDTIKLVLNKIVENISPLISEDSFEKMVKIANDAASGTLSSESFLDMYKDIESK